MIGKRFKSLQFNFYNFLIRIPMLCFLWYWHFSSFSLNALAILARCRGIRQSLEQARILAQSSRKKSAQIGILWI